MPTQITKTVKPSGGDYSLLSTALAAVPVDLIAADEQWTIECYTFAGGLDDSVSISGDNNADSTRYWEVVAASGHEYDYATGAGFKLDYQAQASGGTFFASTNSDAYFKLKNIGIFRSTVTSQKPLQTSADNIEITGCTIWNNSGSRVVMDLGLVNDSTINNNLIIQAGTYDCVRLDRVFSGTLFQNNTIISLGGGDAFEPDTTTAGVLKNNLYIGGGGFNSNGNIWDSASDYNASQDNTAVGGNSLQNRTTADLVDYAGGDYRTAASSALATAGEGGTFIGFALESGGSGETIVLDSGSYLLSGTDLNLIASLNISTTTGSYTLTGSDANLIAAYKEIANTGNYTLTGTDVTLVYTPSGGGESITLDSGTYSMVGQDKTLSANFVLNAQAGSYQLSGTNTPIKYNGSIHVDSGFYSLTGSDLSLYSNYVIIASTGDYELTGSPVTLRYSGDVFQNIGAVTAGFADSGISTAFKQDSVTAGYKANSITVRFK
jgi:hypothetical protein